MLSRNHSWAKILAVSLPLLLVVVGCGGQSGSTAGTHETNPNVRHYTVTGEVHFPKQKPPGKKWSKGEIMQFLYEQEGVEKVECRSLSPGKWVQHWSCRVVVHHHPGRIGIHLKKTGVLVSEGNGIPGVSFGE